MSAKASALHASELSSVLNPLYHALDKIAQGSYLEKFNAAGLVHTVVPSSQEDLVEHLTARGHDPQIVRDSTSGVEAIHFVAE